MGPPVSHPSSLQAASPPGPSRRPRALRTWVAVMAVVAVAYMATLALYLVLHIGPLSGEMARRSLELSVAVERIRQRSEANLEALESARRGVERAGAAGSAGPPPPEPVGNLPVSPFPTPLLPPELEETAARVSRAESVFRQALEVVDAGLAAGSTAAAREGVALAEEAHLALHDALAELQFRGLGSLAAQEALLAERAREAGRTALLWLFGGTLILGVAAAVVHRRVGVPLHQLDLALRRVEGGDLAVEVEPAGNDEVGALVRRFNAMTRELRERAREEERMRSGLASRLERFLDHAVVEVFVLDADTLRIRQVNRSALRNLGYPETRLLEMRPAELLTAESVARARPVLDDLRSGLSQGVELVAELVRADGSSYPVDSRIFYAPHDTPPSFLILAHDLSAHRQGEAGILEARQAARQALLRFRSLVEASPLGVVEWNPDLQVDGWDGEAPRILGRRREEVLGRGPAELGVLAPGEEERVERRLRSLLDGEDASDVFPARLQTPEGLRDTVWYTSVVRDEEGSASALLSLVDDVTEEARVLQALRASEERYRLLFERNPLPMWIFHRDDLTFLDVNEAAVEHYGYTREEFLSMTVEAIRPPEEVPRFHAGRNTSAPGLMRVGTWTHRKADGTLIQVEIIRYGFTTEGVPAVLVLALDVTERRAAEEELRRSREELQRFTEHLQTIREEEQTRLAREIHDELGQALTGVRMGLARLSSRVRGGDPEEAGALVDETVELVDTSIREVRRIATQLRPGVLDQLGLVAALEWLAEDFQGRSGTTVETDLPDADPGLPAGTQTHLFRSAQEALTNVARHSGASRVQVSLRSDGREAVLSVADDGRGFDLGTVPEHSLGLVGMRERARLVGGHLVVESAPGRGTRVIVTVSLDQGSPDGGATAAPKEGSA